MTQFRLDVSRETGAATLWMEAKETACNFKPILAWQSVEGVTDFALMLLEIAHRRERETEFASNHTEKGWLNNK